MACEGGSSKILIYYHGNAEDIGISFDFLHHISKRLKCHVIAPEYPGYGIYPGEPKSSTILEDTLIVFDFLVQQAKWPEYDIWVFGRSIGSGPATHLARNRKPQLLILMSAYTSIKDVAKEVVGWLSFLVKQRFQNIENIKNVESPILLIHGDRDEVINCDHSENLNNELRKLGKLCRFEKRRGMTHNIFDLNLDIIEPILKFIQELNFTPKNGDFPEFPSGSFDYPK
eukprot:TRINITY_DN1163_c0_g1_i3.p1 TRINITY_DN1163_c0_g1~~TRINITY_DN1163_c0_g1_i3.p1  ORF type:complete len:228 (+),score=24.28 TRINITY_DN1163_c0_g1_i3:294-977(+)